MSYTHRALRRRSHSFTCKLHHACLDFPAAEHHRPLAGTHFTVPRRVEGWVDLSGWLHTVIKCRLWESNPDTVTHPSTNWARRSSRVTLLIWPTPLPLRHAATQSGGERKKKPGPQSNMCRSHRTGSPLCKFGAGNPAELKKLKTVQSRTSV